MKHLIAWEAEIKADNRIVEDWLLWINERKQAILSVRLEIIESSGSGMINVGIGRKNIISDPTGQKGLKLADPRIQRNEEWIRLIEEVENRLDEKMRLFLELRREHRNAAGRNGWTAAVQWRYTQEAAKRFGKNPEETWVESRNTFTAWWNKIVNYTARQAAKRGLFNG